MNCTTIVETASDSADSLHIGAYFAAQKYFWDSDHRYPSFLTNVFTLPATQHPTDYVLFESLPYEILTMILNTMDLKSLWALAATNRHLRTSIFSSTVIGAVQKSHSASYALRRLIADDVGNTFTVIDFQNVFMSKACTTCGRENEFAPLLDLVIRGRLCVRCAKSERTLSSTSLVLLPFLGCSNGTFQIQGARKCEGCIRDIHWNRGPDGKSQARARAERAYLKDQFLAHFSECETAWQITAGQRMKWHDEWWLCWSLEQYYAKVWDKATGDTLPATTFRAAVEELKRGKESTPAAFRAEYTRLKGIVCEAGAQKIRQDDMSKELETLKFPAMESPWI